MTEPADPIRVRATLTQVGVAAPGTVTVSWTAPLNAETLHLMQLLGRDFSILMLADAPLEAPPAPTLG